jgi:sensor domain CHASE-containing protein/nitrogen-specific signal transduction histidine kinase
MRLVTKINLALLGVVAVSAVLNFAALRLAVMPSFAALEEQAADQNQGRVSEAIGLQKEQVGNSAGDYAIWDDTYAFMKGEAADYEAKNVTAESLKTLGVNYFVALDNEGRVVLDSGYVTSDGSPVPVKLFPTEAPSLTSYLVKQLDEIKVQSGLMRTDRGLVVIGFAPILRSDRSGERAGTLVLGRVLDADALKVATKVDFDLVRPGDASGDLSASNEEFLYRIDHLSGIDGEPVGTLFSRTSRKITAVGEQTILTTLLFLLAGAAFLLLALAFVLRKIAVKRIEKLGLHLRNVASTGKLETLAEDGKGDELSEALRSFNEMARQLADLRDKLRKQDYDHGAADQAAGLLHNVRNAMSPVSVLAWDLSRQSETTVQQNLAKALEQLKDPDMSPDRTAKLNQFVTMSAARLIEHEAKRQDGLRSLVEMLRHIDDILKETDRSAQLERVVEPIDLEKSVRDAARLLERRGTVDLDLGQLDAGSVHGHKVPLDQVLANILLNAAEAVEASAKGLGKIVVETKGAFSVQGAAQIVLTIRDDGVGIEHENMPRIFEKGFSTKREGKRGLGLHWCANAVNAMGGKIAMESGGAEQGTCVTITLAAIVADKVAA